MAGGLRRGQRGAVPRLTPEQQALRVADGEAEQALFDAIRQLWRRGPEGEAAADDLRFLSVGKGQQGLAAARDYLAGKGLDDVVGGVLPPVQAARQVVGALGRGVDWLRERSREQEARDLEGDVGFSEAMNRAAAGRRTATSSPPRRPASPARWGRTWGAAWGSCAAPPRAR